MAYQSVALAFQGYDAQQDLFVRLEWHLMRGHEATNERTGRRDKSDAIARAAPPLRAVRRRLRIKWDSLTT